MAIPSISDLIKYTTSKLTGADWNANLTKIVNWLTDGTADISVKTLTTTGSQTIGGSETITGNLIVSGTTTSTGNITTSGYFLGDGSLISNLNMSQTKNFIINGGCILKDNADYTLINNTYGTSVNRMFGMASGTAVSAGTFTQNISSSIGRTGYSVKFSGCTITGTGLIYLRYRIESKNAKILKNQNLSFSCKCYQNTGAPLNYTIYANKANSEDDFSSVIAISNSGAQGVADSSEVSLKYENFAVGDCSNGLEIIIKAECGAITTKNFEFTELQLEINTTASAFDYDLINNTKFTDSYTASTKNISLPYFQRLEDKCVLLTTAATTIDITGLDGDTDIEYEFRIFFVNAYNGSNQLLIRLNNDSTTNRYSYQRTIANGTTLSTSETTTDNFLLLAGSSGSVAYGKFNFNVKSGFNRLYFGLANSYNNIETNTLSGKYIENSVNITNFRIFSMETNGIGIGTRIEVYARR